MRPAVLVALVGVALACRAAPAREDVARPPSFLILVTDDHPHDHLGCAGHPLLCTPNMDELARRGLRFTRAFVTTPICAASRASLLTGRYERSHGYTFQAPPLAGELVRASYPWRLREAGYRVGFVGKLGVNLAAEDLAGLFDEFSPGILPYLPADDDGSARHLTDRNVDRAVEFLHSAGAGPFCLSLSFQAPHADDHLAEQYVWPDHVDGLYEDAVIPPPENGDAAFFEALPEFLRTGLNRERWYWRFDTREKRERMVKGYYRMLSGVDAGIGRLLATLDELGRREDTVIVLMGDNGYFLGERGYAGKWTMHERSIRVPLIVVDPRRPGNRSSEVFALNIDLAPTVLDLAGLDIPAGVQGRSLRPWLEGHGDGGRDEVFTEHLWDFERIPRTEGQRTGRWKYIRYLDHPEYEELYDLERDPGEAHNLADDPRQAARLEELRTRCSAAALRAAGS